MNLNQVVTYSIFMPKLCNGCNMAMGDLPNMYAQGLRATGIHISQIPHGHVASIMYHFVPIVTTPVVLIPQIIHTCSQGYKYKLLMQGVECLHSPTVLR